MRNVKRIFREPRSSSSQFWINSCSQDICFLGRASLVPSDPRLLARHRPYPDRTKEAKSLMLPSSVGLPTTDDGSTRSLNDLEPQRRSLALSLACSPSEPHHRRLQRLRCLHLAMMLNSCHHPSSRRPTGGLLEKTLVQHDRFVPGTPPGRTSIRPHSVLGSHRPEYWPSRQLRCQGKCDKLVRLIRRQGGAEKGVPRAQELSMLQVQPCQQGRKNTNSEID